MTSFVELHKHSVDALPCSVCSTPTRRNHHGCHDVFACSLACGDKIIEADPTHAPDHVDGDGGWNFFQLAQQFRKEVTHNFAIENAAWRAWEERDLAEFCAQNPDLKNPPPWLTAGADRDSFKTEVFSAAHVSIWHNSVEVTLPRNFGIYADFIEMFKTSVNWSHVGVSSTILDGESHVVLGVTLVDFWNDARALEWTIAEVLGPTG